MSNTYTEETRTWAIDETGELEAGAVQVQFIYFIPQSASHDLVLTDADDNAWLSIKADPGAANPIFLHFYPAIRLPSLKVATLDGTSTATIQLRTDI